MTDVIYERPGWTLWLMRLAYVTAQRGSCRRKRVGALIVDEGHRIVTGGYNGAPSGMPDCLQVGCDVRMIDGRESCVRTLHAESNALDDAGREARGCTLVATVVPCRLCALRIVQAGISRVIYHEWYVSQGTAETTAILEAGGVRLHHFDVPYTMVDGYYFLGPNDNYVCTRCMLPPSEACIRHECTPAFPASPSG